MIANDEPSPTLSKLLLNVFPPHFIYLVIFPSHATNFFLELVHDLKAIPQHPFIFQFRTEVRVVRYPCRMIIHGSQSMWRSF